jgi:hypothetical protein
MSGKRLWLTAAGSATALLVAIYFGVHSRGTRPAAPEFSAPSESATSTSVHSPEASARVDQPPTIQETPAQAHEPEQSSPITDLANNPSNAFRELRQCVYASRELINAKHLADCRFYEGKPDYQVALAECMHGRTKAQSRIAAAEAVLSHCDATNMGTRYFQATKQAAKQGDVDAQLCYLQGDFFSPEGAQIFTDAENEQYKKGAPRYVDAALKRGDWRVVELLNTRHFHPGSGPLYLLEGVGDRNTQYKMTRLLRLGSSGSYAEFLDGRLESMKHPDLDPSAAVPPQVVKESDAWAQQTYTDYFAGVPGLTEAPTVCGPEPGTPGSLPDLIHPDEP